MVKWSSIASSTFEHNANIHVYVNFLLKNLLVKVSLEEIYLGCIIHLKLFRIVFKDLLILEFWLKTLKSMFSFLSSSFRA